ncbi:MAG TPA: amino acid permease [Thermoanaerobaculia bacterium]|nr:amino acid permease [Thermoanaerobaculia bacterium]
MTEPGAPRPMLSVSDGVAIVIGIVIGSAIFETPALVAANTGSASNILLVWTLGAVISVIGALCYAELASAYPDAGGDYHFLRRAWGRNVSFLYGWARMSVIQTGSIALIAFVFGDYASQIFRLGTYSPAIYAAVLVLLLTMLHLAGMPSSRLGMRWLMAAQMGGLLLLIAAGAFMRANGDQPVEPVQAMTGSSFGLAMVFVLLSYGGWNEAAFVSAELHDPKKSVVRVMLISIAIIATIYLLVNVVLMRGLGIEGMARSEAVAADLMRIVAGQQGAILVSILVVACAVASINAMIFTGARTTYALGRDFHMLSAVGRWRSGGSVPANALIVQTGIIMLLILFGALRRKGFETMVDYTAPVFWMFFFLTTVSLIRLRRIDRSPRPFTVPLYPLTPLVFALICAYLFYSSVMYTGVGALVGLAVVATGIPLLLLGGRSQL